MYEQWVHQQWNASFQRPARRWPRQLARALGVTWLLLCATVTAWFGWRTWQTLEPARSLTTYHALPVVVVPVPVPGPGCQSAGLEP